MRKKRREEKKKNFEEEKFRSLKGEGNFAEMPRVDTKNPYCLQKGRGCQRNLINMGERFHRSTVRHSCINMKIIYNRSYSGVNIRDVLLSKRLFDGPLRTNRN